ncbi:MAG: hypothetical protein KDB14_34770 [Planctomycetales bacterium]|nr:hypothetical protein [Planctomycetales bacterium]
MNAQRSARGPRRAMAGCALALFLVATACRGAEPEPYTSASCSAPMDSWFTAEVWAKVGAGECIKCHNPNGDASDTDFVLRDPGLGQGERDARLRQNRDAFRRMALRTVEGEPLLLQKVVGQLDHGGKEVLKLDSAGYRILAEFVRRVKLPATASGNAPSPSPGPPFFEGVAMLDNRRLLRRATLSLAGRLPTTTELERVAGGDPRQVAEALEPVLREEAFYDRLREGFNDIFLTLGVGEGVLSYEHFEKTRHWNQHYDLSHIKDEKERRQAGYKLAREYREALHGEPMKLIEYIVRNDRPFSEIITADYIMVSPYSARGYGVFDELKEQFHDSDDPFEYLPVKLKALVGRNKSQNQESATGFYPHAGLLSTFQYLTRYPTTETNRNRLRARMYFQHFLGVDVLELAARVSDAAAVSAKYEIPTMQASECVVCHKSLDPVAGLFQDYWRFDANFSLYGRRKEGWFDDMFAAGFEGEALPAEERWRALQWLGERTVKDPRFAVAMVEHGYYLLTGRRPLLVPKDLDDPLYEAKHRAYLEQRRQLEAIAARFAQNEFDFRGVIKDLVVSDFYRADGLAAAGASDERLAELEDVGVARLLSPEQLERKVAAVFGKPWGKLQEQTAMLYGGIDSREVTERATDPSGAMGAIQRTLSNDVACRNVALDFSREPDRRLLFPRIEPDVLPGQSAESDTLIRETIVHLHLQLLGRYDRVDSPEVERTYRLLADIVREASQRRHEDQEAWSCRQGLERPVPDPHYTVRAWRAVVTYLLRQPEFLYE